MHRAQTQLLGIVSSLVILTACGQQPIAPTPVDSAGATLAGQESLEAVTSKPACQLTFAATPNEGDATFFVLTINTSSGCRWFARNVESDGSYWDLTTADYALRNFQKYPRGVTGVGTQRVGVHFIKKIGYRDHRTFQLEACDGTSCSATARKWTWTYTIAVP